MLRSLIALLTAVIALACAVCTPVSALPTTTPDAPIGMLGETLRVEYEDNAFGRFVADVTVHDVVPSEIPPGWSWAGAPRWRAQGGPWKAHVTVHAVEVPTPYTMAVAMTFNGVTPGGDSYTSKHSDDPEALDMRLSNAPEGSTTSGVVYWDVYRGLVTNILLLSKKTGLHLAQWNIPG